MNIKNKKTVLGDDAALYSHKEDLSEKVKWEAMSPKERLQYFIDYYLAKIIVVTIVVAVIGSILYTMLSPKPETVFSVAVVEDGVHQSIYDDLQAKFHEVIELDEETQQTRFDTTYYFSGGDYQVWQKFAMYNMVGDLDVTLLPKSLFEEYAPNGYFSPVAAHLSSSVYDSLSDYLLETRQKDEDGNLLDGTETVYGVDLSSTWLYKDIPMEDPMVLVVNAAPKNSENIERFLMLLFFPDDAK